jgi:hypothetical protein
MSQPSRTLSDSVSERLIATSIPPEVWATHKDDIRREYCENRLSLIQLKDYMRKEHFFEAR